MLEDLKMTDCKGYRLGTVARVHTKDDEDYEDFFDTRNGGYGFKFKQYLGTSD